MKFIVKCGYFKIVFNILTILYRNTTYGNIMTEFIAGKLNSIKIQGSNVICGKFLVKNICLFSDDISYII